MGPRSADVHGRPRLEPKVGAVSMSLGSLRANLEFGSCFSGSEVVVLPQPKETTQHCRKFWHEHTTCKARHQLLLLHSWAMEERESADAVPPPKNLPGSPHNVPTYIAVTCIFYWQGFQCSFSLCISTSCMLGNCFAFVCCLARRILSEDQSRAIRRPSMWTCADTPCSWSKLP